MTNTRYNAAPVELPVDYDSEQYVVDKVARVLNDGKLQTPHARLQEVARVLVSARRAYRIGRSVLEFETDEVAVELSEAIQETNGSYTRNDTEVFGDVKSRALVIGAYETGRLHRDTMVSLEPRPVFDPTIAVLQSEHVLHGESRMHRFGDI